MPQSRQKQYHLAWLIAAGMTAVLFLCVFGFLDVYLAVNDDASIARSFLGYGTGTPATFHLFIHGLLAWPLHWLSCLFPGIAWFSVLQLVMLFLSFTVIGKSIMQCFIKAEKPLWLGALLALVFLIAFGVENLARFTYTVTASMLGAAAVAHMLSLDYDNLSGKRIVSGVLGSALLVMLAYSLRKTVLLPVLAFCGIAFLHVCITHFGLGRAAKRSFRPMAAALGLTVLLLGGMLVWREADIQANQAQEYRKWDEVRVFSIDYYGLAQMKPEDIEVAGWSAEEHALAHDWCFLPTELSIKNFERLNEHLHAKQDFSLMDYLRRAKKEFLYQINRVMQREYRLLAVVVVMGVAAAIGALLCKGRRIRLLASLGLTAAALGVMLIYLGSKGRLPLRATLTPYLPATALICGLLPACFPSGRAGRACLAALLAVCMAHAAVFVAPALPYLAQDEPLEREIQALGDLERYAMAHPDSLFLYDNSFSGADVRPFPDYSQGVPTNIASWGGWEMRSGRNREQFLRFGIDLDTFQPEEMLREDLFLASIGPESDGPLLMEAWLESELGCEILCTLNSEAPNVYVYQFSKAQ